MRPTDSLRWARVFSSDALDPLALWHNQILDLDGVLPPVTEVLKL
jgi:hypothetical protein